MNYGRARVNYNYQCIINYFLYNVLGAIHSDSGYIYYRPAWATTKTRKSESYS